MKIKVIPFILVYTFNGLDIVHVSDYIVPKSCPLTCEKWKHRAMVFECRKETPYLCIMNKDESPIEICMAIEKIIGEGCPWIIMKEAHRYILGFPLTSCPVRKYCPGPNITEFYTNELCKYPACLVREENRNNFTLPLRDIPHNFGALAAICAIIPVLGIALVFIVKKIDLPNVRCCPDKQSEIGDITTNAATSSGDSLLEQNTGIQQYP